MKRYDLNLSVESPAGALALHLDLTSDLRVERAWSEQSIQHEEVRAVLSWLFPWLADRSLSSAYENVAEAFVRAHPHMTWTWSALPQEIVRQALYLTHPKVRVDKSDREVCRCHHVAESTLEAVLSAHTALDVAGLARLTKASTSCGSCRKELSEMIERRRPAARRWHGESNAHWATLAQESLERWQTRTRFDWARSKQFTVQGFKDGVVTVQVAPHLSADQEWELSQALSDYWAEGFPAPLTAFLEFDLA